jgi:hypothetical protein
MIASYMIQARSDSNFGVKFLYTIEHQIQSLDRSKTLPKDSRGIYLCCGKLSGKLECKNYLQYRLKQAV